MSERTKLLKKAVLTSVGASQNVDRIKNALNEALQDLVKVGGDLMDELEDKGKVKADKAEDFLKNLKDEASKRTYDVEKKVQTSVKKAVKDFGFVSREEYEDLLDRLAAIEEAVHGPSEENGEGGESKKRNRKKASHN